MSYDISIYAGYVVDLEFADDDKAAEQTRMFDDQRGKHRAEFDFVNKCGLVRHLNGSSTMTVMLPTYKSMKNVQNDEYHPQKINLVSEEVVNAQSALLAHLFGAESYSVILGIAQEVW